MIGTTLIQVIPSLSLNQCARTIREKENRKREERIEFRCRGIYGERGQRGIGDLDALFFSFRLISY